MTKYFLLQFLALRGLNIYPKKSMRYLHVVLPIIPPNIRQSSSCLVAVHVHMPQTVIVSIPISDPRLPSDGNAPVYHQRNMPAAAPARLFLPPVKYIVEVLPQPFETEL